MSIYKFLRLKQSFYGLEYFTKHLKAEEHLNCFSHQMSLRYFKQIKCFIHWYIIVVIFDLFCLCKRVHLLFVVLAQVSLERDFNLN